MSDQDLNSTLDKLSASINQQAIASINNLIVPEFRGLPEEDVCDFIERFKMATLALSENHRCLALNKALKGAAMTWAKANIKSFMATANWKAIKKLLVERFDYPDRTMRFKERLAKLKYDPETTTLMSYVEAFITLHKRAHGFRESDSASDADAIQALKLNLPDRIVKGLNYLDDRWMDSSNIGDLIKIIHRYETKIMPYEGKEDPSCSPITKDELLSVFKELKSLKDQVKSDLDKHREQITSETKALATITTQAVRVQHPNNVQQSTPRLFNNDRSRFNNRPNRYQANQRPPKANHSSDNKRPRYDQYDHSNRFNYKKPIESQSKPDQSATDANKYQNTSSTPTSTGQDKLVSEYEARYGKLPGPCYHCSGVHFNKHCPLVSSNLN